MDPIVNAKQQETGMSIQMIEKEIAAQIRKHEASLKHWRAVKAATAKLRGAAAARAVRKGVEQMAKRTVKKSTIVVKATPRAMAADRAPKRKPTVGKLIAGTK